MTSSEEMATCDTSDYSEELGMDYPRIEYPKEVHDRVCGILPVKRIVKKQNEKDWLYDSESSRSDSSVSSRDRKKKHKRTSRADTSKKLPAVKKQTSKKDVRKPRARRVVNYMEDTDEESSGQEVSTDSSEVDSPPEKKKRKSILVAKTQRVRSLNEKEGRGRVENGKGAMQKSQVSAKNNQAIETKAKKERKTIGGKSEKKDGSSIEEKQKKQIEANLDKDHRNDKNEKESMKEEESTDSSQESNILSMSLAHSRPRQERHGMANGDTAAAAALSPMSSYNSFPTPPSSAERREAEGAEMGPSIYSRWDAPASPEPESRNEGTPPPGAESRGSSPLSVNTPTSPPQLAASGAVGRPFVETPLPIRIPSETEGRVRYRWMLIDDDCLPSWNRSARWATTRAVYAASTPVQRCRWILVAGPFIETLNKQQFEKLMKGKGADVEWTEAPATKDQAAMAQRSMAAIICYSETTATSLIEEKTIMCLSESIPIGCPLEVLLSVDGMTAEFDQKQLMMEITDLLETNIGPLVELLISAPSRDSVVKGKARFFYAVHGTRAAHGAALPLGGGRSISLAPCPPDKSTEWITEVFRESPRKETKEEPEIVLIEESDEEEETRKAEDEDEDEDEDGDEEEETRKAEDEDEDGDEEEEDDEEESEEEEDDEEESEEEVMAKPRSTRTPLPTPSIVPIAPLRVGSFKIKSSTTVVAPHKTFAVSETCSKEESMPARRSRFGALPKAAAIPPPGLVDPVVLRLLSKENASLRAQTPPTLYSLMGPLPKRFPTKIN